MGSKHSKHIVDVLLGVGLLLLMSYASGEIRSQTPAHNDRHSGW